MRGENQQITDKSIEIIQHEQQEKDEKMNQQRVKDLQSNTRRSNIGFITFPRKEDTDYCSEKNV